MKWHRLPTSLTLALLVACAPSVRDTPSPVATTTPVAVAANRADTSWIARSALYEVFVRDFSPRGDFRGVIDGLDRIQATGANVIWLMPIHPVGRIERKGSLGSSYSVADYKGINPAYGDEDDFRALVQAVHGRGMKLILDFVPNHTAWDNVWMAGHSDRYTHDANGKITVAIDNEGKPTDWTDVADLNYDNPDTRRAMIDAMRYWLERFDIDGYRMDVAGFVPDAFWREAIPQLRAAGADLMLAEWGAPKMHALGFDLTYGWDAYTQLKQVWKGEAPASAFAEKALADVQSLPAGGMRLRFTTNHDETAWDQPPVTLFGGAEGARAAYVAMALLPGPPLLYDGQEVESPQQLGLFEKEAIDWNQPDAAAARTFYRRVIDLAGSEPFATGAFTLLANSEPADVVSYRRGDAIVLVNTRNRPVRFTVAGADVSGKRDALSNRTQRGQEVELGAYGTLVLQPTT